MCSCSLHHFVRLLFFDAELCKISLFLFSALIVNLSLRRQSQLYFTSSFRRRSERFFDRVSVVPPANTTFSLFRDLRNDLCTKNQTVSKLILVPEVFGCFLDIFSNYWIIPCQLRKQKTVDLNWNKTKRA